MQTGFIYKITSPSNKVYIGQTINIHRRFIKYKGLRCKAQPRIYNSLVKYGSENHVFEIIEECNIYDLNIRERHWQDHYDVLSDNGLNCVLTNTDEKYLVRSLETRKKMSESRKGKKLSKEMILALIKRNTGRRHSEETKRKISEGNIGKRLGLKFSDEINKKKGSKGSKHPLYGIGHSEESRIKMSKSHTGKKRSPEAIEKFRNSMKGKMIGADNSMSKKLLHLETGIFYDSIKEAATFACSHKSIHHVYNLMRTNKNSFNLIHV
jgi:group I intron endonuclease